VQQVIIGNQHVLYEEFPGQAAADGASLTVNRLLLKPRDAADAEATMPSNYFTMWGMLILMAFGAVGGPLIHGNVLGSIRAAYPADEVKRDALHRCGEMDADFSRFSQHDRDICYRAVLRATDAAALNPAAAPAGN